MKYEELNTGWLSPAGEFFPCHSYDHNEEARVIVSKFGYSDLCQDEYGTQKIIHADDNLMAHGWVYIGISTFFCHEWRIGWGKFLTEIQKRFLRPYFEESDLPVNEFAVYRWKQEGGYYE